jgi:hypothetical protein
VVKKSADKGKNTYSRVKYPKKGEVTAELVPEYMAGYAPYALFALALLVRVYFMPAGLLHTDSVIAVEGAERTVANGHLQYLQGVLGYPGYAAVNSLIFFVYHALTGAKSAQGVLLFSSAFFGALGVALIYILTVKLTSSRTAGLYAGVILCFLPIHLSLSTYVKDQVLGTCVLLSLALIAMHARQSDKLWHKLAAGSTLGYAMAIRQQEVLFLPIMFLFYYLPHPPIAVSKAAGRVRVKLHDDIFQIIRDGATLVLPIVAVFVLFFVPKMIDQPGFSLWGSLMASSGESAQGFGLFTEQLFRSISWVGQVITPLGWLILAVSVIVCFGQDRRVWLVLTVWMAAYFMFYGNLSGASPYFFFNAFPPAVILMGWGLDYGFRRWNHAATVALVVLVALMLANISPVLEYRKAHCGPCEFSEKMRQLIPANSALIGMDETRHYEYYAKVPIAMGHADPFKPQELAAHFERLRALMKNGTSVYVTTADLQADYPLAYLISRGMLVYDQDRQMLANKATNKVYGNLRLIVQGQSAYMQDGQTQEKSPLYGLYGLELFNEFKVSQVFTQETEDWHHKDLESGVYQTTLYKVSER